MPLAVDRFDTEPVGQKADPSELHQPRDRHRNRAVPVIELVEQSDVSSESSVAEATRR